MNVTRTLVFIAACCCLVCGSMPAQAALVGLWRFEEGSGLAAADSSGNGSNGSLSALAWDTGAGDYVTNDTYAPSWVAGKYGSAVEFNPTYVDPWPRPMVQISSASTLNLTESFTIAAWMWFESSGGVVNAPNYSTLFTKVGSYMIQGPTPGDANYYVWENSITPPGLQEGVSSSGLLLDQWVHVALVYDFATTTLTLYYDGTPVASHGVPTGGGGTQYVASGGDLFLGHYPFAASGSYERSYSGKMDDVALFNTALGTSDISTIMTGDFSSYIAPVEPPAGDLLGLWLFDEGSGTTAADSSIHGNDGTLNGYNGPEDAGVQDLTALPTWTTGVSGSALQFTPDLTNPGKDAVVEIPEDDIFDVVDYFTFMCWANPTGDGGGGTLSAYGYLFQKQDSYYFQLDDSPGDPDLYVWNDAGVPGINTGVTGPSIPDEWHHYAFTFDDGTLTLYIDGVESDQVTGIIGRPTTADLGIIIGRDRFRASADYHGAMDEVAFFNYPLDITEINTAMSGDFSPWLLAQLPTDETGNLTVEVGDDVTLTVPYPGNATDGDFTWTFTPAGGGSPQVLAGENDATLLLEDVQTSDSGTYEASYDNSGAKFAAMYTVTLNVVEGLPVGSLVGFGTLALGLAAAAAGALRRKT